MDTKTLLGKRIREIRQNHKYTQSQLAELLGIDDKHLSRVELGKNMPNPAVLDKIAEIFNVEIKDLFEFSHLQNAEIIRTNLMDTISKMPEEQLILAYKYVRSFLI